MGRRAEVAEGDLKWQNRRVYFYLEQKCIITYNAPQRLSVELRYKGQISQGHLLLCSYKKLLPSGHMWWTRARIALLVQLALVLEV